METKAPTLQVDKRQVILTLQSELIW